MENYFKNLLLELIDTYIDYNDKYPHRLVMIRMDKCYCCNKNTKELIESYSDDYLGRFKRIGWISCEKCELYLNLSKNYYEKKLTNYYPNRLIQFYKTKRFNFWRVSLSNKNIPAYVQKEAFYVGLSTGNFLQIYEKNNKSRISICMNWMNEVNLNDIYKKYVPLANLIFYNKDLFGNSYSEMNLIKIDNYKWKNLFKKEYEISNYYSSILKILNFKFGDDIGNIIFNFNNFLHQY